MRFDVYYEDDEEEEEKDDESEDSKSATESRYNKKSYANNKSEFDKSESRAQYSEIGSE